MWILEQDKDGNEIALCLICRDTLPIKDMDREDYSDAMDIHVEIHNKTSGQKYGHHSNYNTIYMYNDWISKNMIDMPKLTEFEEEYYKWEGKYELMDPDKFYQDVEEYVQKDPKKSV